MKRELALTEVEMLVRGWRSLVGSRVDQVYQPSPREIVFQFRRASDSKLLLRVIPPLAHLLSAKQVMPQSIPGFCAFLRKHLANAKVCSLSRVPGERVVRIVFEKGVRLVLFLELFGKGNVVLCDEDNHILGVLEVQERHGVRIAPREVYHVEVREDPFAMSVSHFACKDVAALASLGLGNVYAREVLRRADKKSDAASLYAAWKELIDSPVYACIVRKDGQLVDVTPWTLRIYDGYDIERGDSFDAALEKVLEVSGSAPVEDRRLTALRASLEQQRASSASLMDRASEAQRMGEWIYEHYLEVRQVLDEAVKHRKDLGSKKSVSGLRLKHFDPAKGEITVEFSQS